MFAQLSFKNFAQFACSVNFEWLERSKNKCLLSAYKNRICLYIYYGNTRILIDIF